MPLYTACLTPKDYGVANVSTNFISTVCFIVSFSLESSVTRFFVDLKNDKKILKRFYGTIATFIMVYGNIVILFLIFFRSYWSNKVFQGVPFFPLVFICLINLVFSCEYSVYDAVLKSQQKALKNSIITLLYFLTQLSCNLILILVFKWGALGVITSSLITSIFFTIIFIIDMCIQGSFSICIDIKLLTAALRYSIPIMPHNLSTSIATLISSILIGNTKSLSALGVYSVANQFGHIADMIQGYIHNAYSPWLFEQLYKKENDYKEFIRKIVGVLCDIIGFFFVGIAIFSQELIILMVSKDFIDAWRYVPLIVMVYTVKIGYYFYVSVLFYYKNASRIVFIATLSSSLLNIFFSSFLIPLYDIKGSILADGISMLVRVIIVVIISMQFDDIGLCISDIIIKSLRIITFILLGLTLSFNGISDKISILNILYKSIIILIYFVIICINNKDILNVFVKKHL